MVVKEKSKVREKKGRYAKNLYEFQVHPPIPGRKRDPNPCRIGPLVCDAKRFPASTHHVEYFIINKPGTPYIPGHRFDLTSIPPEIKKFLPVADDDPVWITAPMYHTHDEIFVFAGTNPDDLTDLGGEVEFWLGLGEEAEKLTITKSSFVWVPAGLVHCPVVYTKVDRPFLQIVIAPNPTLVKHHVDLWPPGYKPM